jgi:hypothetical protein
MYLRGNSMTAAGIALARVCSTIVLLSSGEKPRLEPSPAHAVLSVKYR